MNLKLKRALTAMLAGIFIYIFFGILIQIIGDSFHVTWRIIPDLKLLAQYRIYWMLMISFWFMMPFWYGYDLFTKKLSEWQTKRSFIIQRLLDLTLALLCIYMWYGTVSGYQTKFLM